ncbi:MAG: hypothetical protein IJT44_06055 [Clostridia bacterium]|nr:hypothetical protein [Clostridia bacterium]
MDCRLMGAYLTGLLHMASSCSEWVGRSYIEADCFAPGDFPQAFARQYALDEAQVRTAPTDKTLRQALVQWLGGRQPELTDSLLYYIRRELGEATAILELPQDSKLPDKLSWSDGGKSPFYTVEDLFFAQVPQATVCFMLGNNE